jgi:hypothetical protein
MRVVSGHSYSSSGGSPSRCSRPNYARSPILGAIERSFGPPDVSFDHVTATS